MAGHDAGLARVSPLRVWFIDFGTVGRWLADALDTQAQRLASRFGCTVQVVGIANARDGFVYDAGGLNLRSVLAAAGAGRGRRRAPVRGQGVLSDLVAAARQRPVRLPGDDDWWTSGLAF